MPRTDGSGGEPRSRCTRSRRTTRVAGSGSAARSVSSAERLTDQSARVDHSQAKDSEQYETMPPGLASGCSGSSSNTHECERRRMSGFGKGGNAGTGLVTWRCEHGCMVGDSPSRAHRLGEANQARERRTRDRQRLTRRWSLTARWWTALDPQERATQRAHRRMCVKRSERRREGRSTAVEASPEGTKAVMPRTDGSGGEPRNRCTRRRRTTRVAVQDRPQGRSRVRSD
jgi:hypothetical protein